MDAKTLTLHLGGRWRNGRGQAPCPVCQTERRRDQRALSIAESSDRVLVFCFKSRCGFGQIASAIDGDIGSLHADQDARREADERRRRYVEGKLRQARRLWTDGLPISGTKGDEYFRSRGITCDLPDTLRFVPSLRHEPTATWCSAAVANVETTGGVHRTFLDRSGAKLPENAKLMLGPCSGGAVRLSVGAGPLVVTEGIETGLSLMSGLLAGPHRVWAALSAPGMKSLHLPAEPGKLIVATDGDDAGRKAGNALAARASDLGWDVSLMPAPDELDWNDVLVERTTP